MRILFLAAKLHTIEPFGLMSLSPHLRRDGHSVALLEAEDPSILETAHLYRPDVIGYSVCTGSEKYYLALNRSLKERFSFISVFGGPHPTFFPEMIHEPGVDAICRGEGDLAFAEFCRGLENAGQMPAIPNFTIKRGSEIIALPPRPLIRNLDDMPFPDRDLYYHVSQEVHDHRVRSFLAARGCPFACAYCFNPAMDDLYGGDWKKMRIRSPANLVDEIEEVVRQYPTEFIAFRESIFPLRLEWLEEFAERYARQVGLPFYCHLRLDLLNERNVALLARAGCFSANVGLETGNPELRERLLRRRISNRQMVDGCALLRKYNIRVLANNMLGLPGAGFAEDLQTLRLNQQCKPDYALAMLWQPYPGTELADYARRLGYYQEQETGLDFTYYNRSPLRFRDAHEKRRIENLQKLFAIAVVFPALTPLIRLLTRVRPNRFFKIIFRTMYLIFHQTEIFRHRMSLTDWARNLRHIAMEN